MTELVMILTSVAAKVGISPALLIAVCTTETNLRNVDVMMDGGSPSFGICQVKLETAHFMARVHSRPNLSRYSFNDMRQIEKNAKVAALYLKYQIDRYDGDVCKAVAAYNAGRFKESSVHPGLPFNWKYLDKVSSNLDSGLDCYEAPTIATR